MVKVRVSLSVIVNAKVEMKDKRIAKVEARIMVMVMVNV